MTRGGWQPSDLIARLLQHPRFAIETDDNEAGVRTLPRQRNGDPPCTASEFQDVPRLERPREPT